MPMTPGSGNRPVTCSDLSAVKTDLRAELSAVKTDLRAELSAVKAELKSDISNVKAELKSDISNVKAELKSDISNVKAELKSDITAVKTELKSDIKRLSVEIIKTREETATKKDFADLKAHLNRITAGLDKLAGMAADNRRTLLVFDSILGKHDKRLSALEARA